MDYTDEEVFNFLGGFKTRPRWFDKEGKPITVEVADTLLQDWEYKKIAQESIGNYLVSTVWLGLDMDHFSIGEYPIFPLIFETMIFYKEADGGPSDVFLINEEIVDYTERYRTLEGAKEGHEKACEFVREVLRKCQT